MSKLKVIKHFNNLEAELQNLIVSSFPHGFDKYLITFKDPKGKLISALPFETEEKSYFVKMSREEAFSIFTGETFTLIEIDDSDLDEDDDDLDDLDDDFPEEVTEDISDEMDD
jgi:hypothetical protein